VSSVRRLMWAAGAPARAVLIGGIKAYRATLSGWLGGQCRFYPSCSHYAEEAVRVHGAVRGSALTAWRILRCNPFGSGGIEPVPARRGALYDVVIPRHEGSRPAKGAHA
jgi:putative membrane protein insertion efficiency factor